MRTEVKTIVAGIAETGREDPVLRGAALLAARLQARLVLVHAFHLPHPMVEAYYHAGVFGSHIDEDYARDVVRTLEEAARAVASNVDVTAHAYAEAAVEGILRVARREDADLVIVGPTRRRPLGRRLIGTTADRVVRQSDRPVLVMRTPLPVDRARVLLTTDLTEFSVGVYEHGADLVEAIAGDVEVEARCLLAVWWGATLPPPLPANRADEMVQSELKAFLDARQARPFDVEPVVRIGTPAPEIVDESEATPTDLVVLGTHSRRGLERLFLGSVAAAALRDVQGNVLVIPAAETDQDAPAGEARDETYLQW
jgi:nucleotide-binding universal stress UspA family protein